MIGCIPCFFFWWSVGVALGIPSVSLLERRFYVLGVLLALCAVAAVTYGVYLGEG